MTRFTAGDTFDAMVELKIPRPRFWDGVRDPYLYTVDVQIHAGPPSEAWYKDITLLDLSAK